MKSVIWDFNGTIIDDVHLATESMNELLRRRGLPTINVTTHRRIFGFPVSGYYSRLGLDLVHEEQSSISDEFHEVYQAGLRGCTLNPGIAESLEHFESAELKQFVLSAAEQQMVESWVDVLGIHQHFSGVYGLTDRLAASKEQRCRDLIEDFDLIPSQTYLIGDTDHDVDVAQTLGCRPVAVLQGHQDKITFGRTDCQIFESFYFLVTGLELD